MPIVNYVREHVRFIEYASEEKLKGAEMLLWYALMHQMNQRAQGNVWPEEFVRIDNDRLLSYLPMQYDTFNAARNRLKQLGRIDFLPGKKNKENPAYKVNYFYPEYVTGETERDGYLTRNPAPIRIPDGGRTREEWEQISMKGVFPEENGGNTGGKNKCYPEKSDNIGDNIESYPKISDKVPDNMGGNIGYNIGYNIGDNIGGNIGDIYYKHKAYTDTQTQTVNPEMDEEEDDEEDNPRGRAREDEMFRRLAAVYQGESGRTPLTAEITRMADYLKRAEMDTEMGCIAIREAMAAGARNPIAYATTVLEDLRRNDIETPEQLGEFRFDWDCLCGRNGQYGSGDSVEDWKRAEEHRKRRVEENARRRKRTADSGQAAED